MAKDCRKYMPTMKDSSVSLIVTDPPYFIDGMGDEWNNDILARRLRPGGVVGSLPAGMKFDVAQGEKPQSFLQPIAREWIRLIKPGGFVLCFAQNRLVHRTAMAIEMAGFEIRDILAWRYEGQAKAFSQEHFIRKRRISESEKKRLIKKLGGRKTPQLKPKCELIVMAQAPREGTFVDKLQEIHREYLVPHKVKLPKAEYYADNDKERVRAVASLRPVKRANKNVRKKIFKWLKTNFNKAKSKQLMIYPIN